MAEEDEASSEDELMEWETACALLQEAMDTDEQFEFAVDGYLSSDDDVKKESNWKSVPNKPRNFIAAHSQLVADYFNNRMQSIYEHFKLKHDLAHINKLNNSLTN